MTTEAEVRLPRPPGVIRRALAAHPFAVDVFIVVWYFIGTGIGLLIDLTSGWGLAEGVVGEWTPPTHLAWPLVLLTILRTLAIAAALLFRRRYPLLGLIVVVVAMFGPQGAMELANGVAVLFMLYAVPVYRTVQAGWIGYAVAVVGSILQLLLPIDSWATGAGPGLVVASGEQAMQPVETVIGMGSVAENVILILMNAVWYLAILMLGINLGNRRRYVEAIIDRAHQLARERDQRAQLAVAEERSRIAREMHDIVAHSVSVMIALSEGAARAANAAPDAAADAMRRSADTGRTALAEMRRLLGALHSPGESSAELVPQPGVDQIPGLIAGFRDAGLDVEFALLGRSDVSVDRGQELAVYRVVQEGLTNVLRYAGTGARAVVTVDRSADRTTVDVRDYGRAPGSAAPVSGVGSGRGLAGLAERARVFGGRIDSGPVPAAQGGGWRLWAVLPLSSAAQGPRAGEAAPGSDPSRRPDPEPPRHPRPTGDPDPSAERAPQVDPAPHESPTQTPDQEDR